MLSALCALADDEGRAIILSPDPCFGVPLDVLVHWYAGFGFRPAPGGLRRESQERANAGESARAMAESMSSE